MLAAMVTTSPSPDSSPGRPEAPHAGERPAEPAATEAAASGARRAPARADWRKDPFFATYFQRIDPAVADSFTSEQRAALRLMFGGRAPGRHLVDFRRSLPLFGQRIYLVLLFGKERRSLDRLAREGMLSRGSTWLMYLLLLLLLAIPLLGGLYLLKAAAGIDLLPDGGVHNLLESLGDQITLLFGG